MTMLAARSRIFARSILQLSTQVQRRTVVTLKDVKYTAHSLASGAGRNGNVSGTSTGLSLSLALPKELGGSGNGENPEQLFGMGYAACFLGALQAVARQRGAQAQEAVKNANIETRVHIGSPSDESGLKGFVLEVDIRVSGVQGAEGEELVKAAHAFCPYSRALTHGAVVNVSVV